MTWFGCSGSSPTVEGSRWKDLPACGVARRSYQMQAHFLRPEAGLRPWTSGPKGTWPEVELERKIRQRDESTTAV